VRSTAGRGHGQGSDPRLHDGIAQGGTALKRDGKERHSDAKLGDGIAKMALRCRAVRSKAKLWRGDEMRRAHRQSYAL